MIIRRRHAPPCESKDRSDPRCGCPIFQEYRVGTKRFRLSLKTRNWQKALADARKKEMDGFKEKPKSPMIEDACEKYMQDARARELKPATIYKFDLLFRQLKRFASDDGLVFVSDLNLDNLRRFRATWSNRNESARVKLGGLKSFIRFCHESKWLEENYARALKAAKVADVKIVPLTADEFNNILKACDTHGQKEDFRKKLRALVLLMYYSGLRIRDSVTLRREAIRDGKLFLRTTKTGTDVFCPLPPVVVRALNTLPGDHLFHAGHAKPRSVVGDYQRALRKLFKNAKVPRAFPHLFRHTFITNMLAAGVAVETVAVLAGHSSSKITTRKYSHWIKERQDSLEAEVKKSWAQMGTVA
jgi:integrase/recombinase XerD